MDSVNIANGTDSASKLLIPIELKQWISDWIFLGLSLDYGSSNLFIFVKSFSSLGNEMKSLEKLNFGDFQLQPNYEIVIGGIEKQNYQNFKGVLYDWNLATFYMGTITEFSYMLTGKSKTFDANGILFATDLGLASNRFVTWGAYTTSISTSPELQDKIQTGISVPEPANRLSQNLRTDQQQDKEQFSRKQASKETKFNPFSSQTRSAQTHLRRTRDNRPFFSSFSGHEGSGLAKTSAFSNTPEQIEAQVYGAQFKFKDWMTISGLLLGSSNTPQVEVISPGIEKPQNSTSAFAVKKFLLYINFSFKEIVGDELILFSSSSPNAPNGFYVSLVEKAKEDFFKQFFEDGIHVLPANFNFEGTYTYDSSQKKPKVLKLHLTTNDNKKLTFVSPIQIRPQVQYRVTIGFVTYPPSTIRAFFQYENKFVFTHEEANLEFVFADQEVEPNPSSASSRAMTSPSGATSI